MSERLVLVSITLLALSGVPGLFLSRRSNTSQWLATLLTMAGAGFGLTGVGAFFAGGGVGAGATQAPGFSQPIRLPWAVPGGEFYVALDGLSAFFLVPILLISSLGSIYGLAYWKQTDHPNNGCKLRLFFGIVAAAMALVAISRNTVLFLAAWEIMALAAFFLVTTEDTENTVCEAGWIYLAATHVAALFLFALFALLRAMTGSFSLTILPDDISPGLMSAVFLLALVGFGLKAGIMPLHIWLPGAHASAPSHVSALMSGVIIKMGIYGILRITSLVPHPPLWWGVTLLALGVLSGILGVAFAIGQHDLKRLLAYHSIENIGIIILGIGLALLGRTMGRDDWMILGMAGGLLHVWNHSLFKGLLFLGAGSVIHATGTRAIDQLGGLAKTMPRTALCFLIGAVAICGLPPLNGFVSEFLIYLGLFRTLGLPQGPSLTAAAFAVPALAFIGTLAVACFVKVFGTVFLGTGRATVHAHSHESPRAMIGPMVVLAACCCLIGFVPILAVPILGQAISTWALGIPRAGAELADLVPFGWITAVALILIAGLIGGGMVLRLLLRGRTTTAATWSCGYLAPTPRIQYTSSSFAQMLVQLFGWFLRPKTQAPCIHEIFPQPAAFHSEVPDTVLDEAVLPAIRSAGGLASRLRVLQQGSIQTYLLYIFAVLLILLMFR
jgi:hydrogenase-4 component B